MCANAHGDARARGSARSNMHRLTDTRKKHVMTGDGIGTLLTTAFNMIKPVLPKIASSIGLAGLLTGVSHGINKALKKDTGIKLNEKTS